MESNARADNLSCPIEFLKYDLIILSFEKLLSAQADVTGIVNIIRSAIVMFGNDPLVFFNSDKA